LKGVTHTFSKVELAPKQSKTILKVVSVTQPSPSYNIVTITTTSYLELECTAYAMAKSPTHAGFAKGSRCAFIEEFKE
jgi:hypothetical protein